MLKIGILDSKNFLLDTGPFLYLLLEEYDDNSDVDVYSKEDNISELSFEKEKAKEYWKFLLVKNVYITPHVLAEASNLIESNYNFDIGDVLAETTSFVRDQIDENFVKKEMIFQSGNDLKVGVTDYGLQKLANNSDKNFVLVYQDGDISYANDDLSFNPQPLGLLLTSVLERKAT